MERVTVGNVEVLALAEGSFTPPAEQLYPTAGEALARYREHINAEGNVEMYVGCFLLRADGRTVLVDTGLGPEAQGTLMRELEAGGVAASDVDVVVFTHLHGDHTGWNLDRESGQPNFPRARYLVPRVDWDHFNADLPESFIRDVAPLEQLGVLELFEGEHSVTPSVTTLPAPGHTPGTRRWWCAPAAPRRT